MLEITCVFSCIIPISGIYIVYLLPHHGAGKRDRDPWTPPPVACGTVPWARKASNIWSIL